MTTDHTTLDRTTPERLFADRMRSAPAAPLVTFYDDETGERAELSAKSMGNWVAKTHFLLIDELGLGPGDRAWVRLPVHWLAVPILLGCWFAGLEVVTSDAAAASAEVAFADADSLANSSVTASGEVFAVSLLSMARSSEPPTGAADYSAAVRPQPDAWATVQARADREDAPALDGLTRADLIAEARARAVELGLAAGGRLLWRSTAFGASEWTAALLAPLAVGGSVVLVRNADPATLERRVSSERASVVS